MNEEDILFTTTREMDLLLLGYPKTTTISIPNASYGNFYETTLETVSAIPTGYVMLVFGLFKSITDADSSWKQSNSYGYLIGTGGADASGANMLVTDISSAGNQVIFRGANWSTGAGGTPRTVNLSIRWYVYLTRLN